MKVSSECTERAARNQDLLSLLKQQPLTNPLTGLLNRRAFEEEALGVIARAARAITLSSVGNAELGSTQDSEKIGLCRISKL